MADMTKEQLTKAIGSWQTINKAIGEFTEVDCKTAINMELMGKRRKDVASRIHQKYCTLRTNRERAELVSALIDAPKFLTPVFEGA